LGLWLLINLTINGRITYETTPFIQAIKAVERAFSQVFVCK
jgi:hypothetical protein